MFLRSDSCMSVLKGTEIYEWYDRERQGLRDWETV
jgi:hypothetical protein